MACVKALAALVTVLAASACDSAAPSQAPTVASIDQKCIEIATTGDMYRYCVQLGLEQAGLATQHSDHGATVTSVPTSD
jgi:hypothetical protein